MIQKYKTFLINEMEEEIARVKGIIGTTVNVYYNFINFEIFRIVEGEKDTYFIVLNSRKDTTFKIEQETTDYKRFRKKQLKIKSTLFHLES